jgi:hypothetical protein
MLAVEVIAAVVLAAVLFVSTWMAIVGLLGISGMVRMRRCGDCGHLVTAWPGHAVCPYCAHPWMAHHLFPVHLRHRLPGES